MLDALATPSAIAYPKWADLVIGLCGHKANAVGYYSFGDEQIAALVARPEAQAHPRIADVVAAARRAFRFAGIAAAATARAPASPKPKRSPARGKPAAAKMPKAKAAKAKAGAKAKNAKAEPTPEAKSAKAKAAKGKPTRA